MDIPKPVTKPVTDPVPLTVAVERWPIAGHFTISRGAKTEAVVVVAELAAGGAMGRGECVPYARYGESVDGVRAAIEAMRPRLAAGLTRADLQQVMSPGAARNALDCAFWDLEAKRSRTPAHVLAGLPAPRPLTTAYTISLATPDEMAASAAKVAGRALLKVKLGGPGDPARIAAVRAAAPHAALIVDANEGWQIGDLEANFAACAAAGVKLIEQPLPEGADAVLADMPHAVPVCADESVHDLVSLPALVGRYDAVNVKLDKSGGLTEALAMIAEAKRLGFSVMLGSMVSTSLATAPAVLAAQAARFVDLDGPLLLAKDRPQGLVYRDSLVLPPSPALWG
jgi:L-alanine-DL-glutamate epimerase-like enolase superfamily enzyme